MEGCSRRQLLTVALAAAPVVLGVGRAVAQQNKAAHAVVQYQDTPKGNQKCSGCLHFVAPNACKLVQSPISPNGWCVLFVPKG